MSRAPRTARSERTREALRQAALVRFLAQGVEETSAEQIAADAGVSLRTFYRHFATKHDLLFADYDAGLQWFRSALAARPPGEPMIESVQAAIFAFPYDVEAVTRIAALRAEELDPERIVRHIRGVQADFADAVAERLRATGAGTGGSARLDAGEAKLGPSYGHGGSARLDAGEAKLGPPYETADDRLRVAVTARCIAAAVFAAMEVWMLGEDRSLAELARMCRTALNSLHNL